MGFKINPCKMFIANKTINGKQTWYVDDVIVSHVEQAVVKQVMEKINSKFSGIEAKYGKKHTYVGMDIDYNEEGTVGIGTSQYVQEVIDSFSEKCPITSKATSPARGNLFTVNTMPPALDPERKALFHHCVAKLLYASKRCRLDILLTISILCTRVTRSTEEDW